jgi:hypothetical protein
MEPLSSDDDLLRELSAALAEADAAATVLAAGHAAWAWRDIDAELAALAYDSALDPRLSELVRAAAPPRTIVFRTADLSVELEVSGQDVAGQLVPPGPGEAELRWPGGGTRPVPLDEAGRFEFDAVPSGLVRLRCRAAGGAALTTTWVRLGG